METTRLVRRALITVCAIALAACSSSSGPAIGSTLGLAIHGPGFAWADRAAHAVAVLLSVSPSVIAGPRGPRRRAVDRLPGWDGWPGPRSVSFAGTGTGDHGADSGRRAGGAVPSGLVARWQARRVRGRRHRWDARHLGRERRRRRRSAAVRLRRAVRLTDAPAWSPDDKEIAFEHGFLVEEATGEGDSSVEVLDLATGTSRPVYDAAATEYVYTPRWSPDGRWIVFELDQFDSPRLDAETVLASTLAIADVTGAAEPRLLLPWDSWATSPDWHPVADQIAYAAPTRAGQDPADIYTVGLDGHDPVRVDGLRVDRRLGDPARVDTRRRADHLRGRRRRSDETECREHPT